MRKIVMFKKFKANSWIIAIYIVAIQEKIDSFWSRIKIDLISFSIYGLTTFLITLLYEVLIAGVSTGQFIKVRILYTFLRVIGVYFLVNIIDNLRKKIVLKKLIQGNPSSFLIGLKKRALKGLSDAISLSIYQIPVYILSALIFGVEFKKIMLISLLYILDNFLFGWLFGYILDKTRLFFAKRSREET